MSFSFDATVSADTLVDICSNIFRTGYVFCFSQRLNDRLFMEDPQGSVPPFKYHGGKYLLADFGLGLLL